MDFVVLALRSSMQIKSTQIGKSRSFVDAVDMKDRYGGSGKKRKPRKQVRVFACEPKTIFSEEYALAKPHMLGKRKLRPLEEGKFKNTLLGALDPDSIQRLRLRRINLDLKFEFEVPRRAIKSLYFLETGMASMVATFQDGSQVEAGTFGYESVIGVSALMGTRQALNRVFTQIAGYGYYCSVESAKAEFKLGGVFQALCLRYVQAQLDQAGQSIGCNVKHKFEPRLARWLLICADRSNSETFTMSHDKLADMLGSTRATVSLAAAKLKKKGLIQYTRGVIKFIDRAKLEKNACECYQAIKDHLKYSAEVDTHNIE